MDLTVIELLESQSFFSQFHQKIAKIIRFYSFLQKPKLSQ